MATYAAYRHIELDKVGYGKKRVLKPPGGGSSDIFGASGGSVSNESTPARRVKNHQQSNLFLNDEPSQMQTPSRNPNDGVHNGENGHSEEMANGSPMMNGNAAAVVNGNTQPAPAQRQRVPPGGFSSGLW